MTFLARIFAWIISDIRHIIIVALSVLLIGAVVYCGYMRWEVAAKDSQISELKVDNGRLALNITNLTAQLEQAKKATESLQAYIKGILEIKKVYTTYKNRATALEGEKDEIQLNNDLSTRWNQH